MMEKYSSLQSATLMYFWLHYSNENHTEKIPVAVQNIDHLLRMASEINESDKYISFCFLMVLELMIMNT